MTETTVTMIGLIGSALIAASAGWVLLRANKDRIDADTQHRYDQITRELRRDVELCFDALEDLRDRNLAWARLVRRHWTTRHPDERIPDPDAAAD